MKLAQRFACWLHGHDWIEPVTHLEPEYIEFDRVAVSFRRCSRDGHFTYVARKLEIPETLESAREKHVLEFDRAALPLWLRARRAS